MTDKPNRAHSFANFQPPREVPLSEVLGEARGEPRSILEQFANAANAFENKWGKPPAKASMIQSVWEEIHRESFPGRKIESGQGALLYGVPIEIVTGQVDDFLFKFDTPEQALRDAFNAAPVLPVLECEALAQSVREVGYWEKKQALHDSNIRGGTIHDCTQIVMDVRREGGTLDEVLVRLAKFFLTV